MKNLLDKAYDPENFRKTGHQLVDQLADYLERALSGEDAKALDWCPPEEMYRRWSGDSEASPGASPDELFADVLSSSVHVHNPRYVGHQISPPVPLSALAGMLGDLLNNGMGVYEMGAPATAIERVVIQMVARKMGLGPAADGVLTSGGSLANLTALLAARSIKGGNVWKEGQQEALALLVSEEAHYCVDRAVRIMGWGEGGIVKVPVDGKLRMRIDQLPACFERAMVEGRKVIAVVGSACTTSTGSFDDLKGIADFCEEKGLWFHVDGAHGAPLAFSEKYAGVVRGIERADSIAMDFHKMLLTPSVTTALLFRNGKHSYATFSQRGQYLWNQDEEEEWHNLAKRTFECTKLMLSLKAYSILRTYGWELFDQYITKVVDLGKAFANMIRESPGMDLATEPDCNIICFRFHPLGTPASDVNRLNENIRQRMLEDGRFYMVKTKLGEETWLRCTLTNPFTTEKELRELLGEVNRMGTSLATEEGGKS